jgi:hypothetical protein
MKTPIYIKRVLLYIYPLILIFALFFTGCQGFDIPTGAKMVDADDPRLLSYYQELTIYIKSNFEVELNQCSRLDIINVQYISPNGELKYYIVEESYNPDFSDVQTFIIYENCFVPSDQSQIKRYYIAKAVYKDSETDWSNVVELPNNY